MRLGASRGAIVDKYSYLQATGILSSCNRYPPFHARGIWFFVQGVSHSLYTYSCK